MYCQEAQKRKIPNEDKANNVNRIKTLSSFSRSLIVIPSLEVYGC